MLKKIVRSEAFQQFKKSKLGHWAAQSYGDWRYPLISLAWLLAKFLVPRRKVSVDGVDFTLPCMNWITHFRWYLFEKKEPEVRFYIDRYLKPGDIFFDIGANIGVFSIYCAKRHKDVAVYSFEPEYSNLNLLKENVILNNLMSRVKIYSVAVGNFVGISHLNLQDLNPGAAVHTESKDPIQITEEGYGVVWSEGIMSVTIDFICGQMGIIPSAMKIDTDGNEYKVLEGGMKTFSHEKCRSVVLELPIDQSKRDYCLGALKSCGFTLAWSDADKTRNEIWVKQK